MNQEYEIQLEQEIESKIKEMESKDYIFPKRFSTTDYVFVATIAIVSLVGIILGAFI